MSHMAIEQPEIPRTKLVIPEDIRKTTLHVLRAMLTLFGKQTTRTTEIQEAIKFFEGPDD